MDVELTECRAEDAHAENAAPTIPDKRISATMRPILSDLHFELHEPSSAVTLQRFGDHKAVLAFICTLLAQLLRAPCCSFRQVHIVMHQGDTNRARATCVYSVLTADVAT